MVGGTDAPIQKVAAVRNAVALYALVGTANEDPEIQLSALRTHAVSRGWRVEAEFADRGVVRAQHRRPALDRLIRGARDGQFTVILVSRLDHFASSIHQFVTVLEACRMLKVNVVSLAEEVDTTTRPGRGALRHQCDDRPARASEPPRAATRDLGGHQLPPDTRRKAPPAHRSRFDTATAARGTLPGLDRTEGAV